MKEIKCKIRGGSVLQMNGCYVCEICRNAWAIRSFGNISAREENA